MTEIPFLLELKTRDLLRELTAGASEPDFAKRPALYVGFDPSATSLHAGSLIPLVNMDRFRRRGGRLIVLLGGATGLIGDPSGKDQERAMETEDTVLHRIECLSRQVRRFFERSDGPEPIYVNNADWYRNINVIEFLRNVGKHFSVNQMLTRDSVRGRLESRDQGISYTEFSYQLFQAYDYLHLHKEYGCSWQMGASDQWGNIVSGIDLVRRLTGDEVHGLTLPLLTNSAGKKYGKSEKGAVWLDPDKTSPYEFYQFWFNVSDEDAPRFLNWLTGFEQSEIKAFCNSESSERLPQRKLAHALTSRLHGEETALLAQKASEAIFYRKSDALDLATVDMLASAVPTYDSRDGGSALILDVMVSLGAAGSKSEARRLIQQKAVWLNNDLVDQFDIDVGQTDTGIAAGILSVGKNRRFLVRYV